MNDKGGEWWWLLLLLEPLVLPWSTVVGLVQLLGARKLVCLPLCLYVVGLSFDVLVHIVGNWTMPPIIMLPCPCHMACIDTLNVNEVSWRERERVLVLWR